MEKAKSMTGHCLRRAGLVCGLLSLMPVALAAGESAGIAAYGSLRTQLESVNPVRRKRLGGYTGLRDAYSRLGIQRGDQRRQGLRRRHAVRFLRKYSLQAGGGSGIILPLVPEQHTGITA